VLTDAEAARARVAVSDGLAVRRAERLVLTGRGRLLADAVVRDVLFAGE
jgi:oxygen-independent coproporphyrinogen-3 oxidase